MEPRNNPVEYTPQQPSQEQWTPPTPFERPATLETDELRPDLEQSKGGSRAVETVAQPPVTPTLPAPVTDDTAAAQPANDDTPLVAADEDVIEKEWVDKAKAIIAETRDDPYQREIQIKKLQADYLRKRYGREIGVVSD